MTAYQNYTAAYVRSRLVYDHNDGSFVWLPKQVRKPDDNQWNRRFAGKQAGCLDAAGYVIIRLDGANLRAHRLAWLMYCDCWPSGLIDHKDTNKANNAITNLRIASFCDNSRNQKTPKTNKSGVKGVCWVKSSSKWQAGIKVNCKSIHLGWFDTKEQAAAAYAEAARKYHGEFANIG